MSYNFIGVDLAHKGQDMNIFLRCENNSSGMIFILDNEQDKKFHKDMIDALAKLKEHLF